MRVKELIKKLQECDPNAIVKLEYEADVWHSDVIHEIVCFLEEIGSVNDCKSWVAITSIQ